MVPTRGTTGVLDDTRQDALATEQMSTRCHRQRLDRVETYDAWLVGGVRDLWHDRLKVRQRSPVFQHLCVELLQTLLKTLDSVLQDRPVTSHHTVSRHL